IHADDLARATMAAAFRGKPNRAYNVSDDTEMQMGEWFDVVADAFHLPRPPRVSREEAASRLAPVLLSFMSESRRLSNARMKRALHLLLNHRQRRVLSAEAAPRALRTQLPLPLGPGGAIRRPRTRSARAASGSRPGSMRTSA